MPAQSQPQPQPHDESLSSGVVALPRRRYRVRLAGLSRRDRREAYASLDRANGGNAAQ